MKNRTEKSDTAIHPDDDRFYTVHETAARLKVSTSTIWRWIESGRLAAFRLGPKVIRIPEGEVERAYQPAYRRQDEPTMMDSAYANRETTLRPWTRLERRHADESIAGLRSLQEQMAERRGGDFLPDSLELIQQARLARSREL